MARGDATRHNLRSSRRSLQSSAAYLRSSSALPTKRAVHPRLRKRSLGSNEVAHAPSPNRRKKRRTSPPKRRPKIEFRASQHPTAPVRTASFHPRVNPQTQRGCAARCERRRGLSGRGCGRSRWRDSRQRLPPQRQPVKSWAERDSNPRRRKSADLQSALVGHLSIRPKWFPAGEAGRE